MWCVCRLLYLRMRAHLLLVCSWPCAFYSLRDSFANNICALCIASRIVSLSKRAQMTRNDEEQGEALCHMTLEVMLPCNGRSEAMEFTIVRAR